MRFSPAWWRAVVVVLWLVPGSAAAIGEESGGFPKWAERVVLEWMNRARVDPAADLAACGANCGDAPCHEPHPPLMWDLRLARAARFHSMELAQQQYFAHDSACTVLPGIDGLFPGTADGSAATSCVGGVKKCSPKCTSWAARIALFGIGPAAEIIASGQDPDNAFYQFLHERSTSTQCEFTNANGHRWIILELDGTVGVGVAGPTVGDFSWPAPIARIPSGSHYPRQGASIAVWANWYDTSGPQLAQVNVDGACTSMVLGRGTPTNGAWTATLAGLATGCHRYVFTFRDAAGVEVAYPTTGSLGIGDASCADWDATRPPPCAGGCG
jgi:hypothetical protein